MSQFSENINDKIDLFLTDKLSPIEKTQFETEIASNPELAQEVSFQRNIIESIKYSRRLELKSRLQNVEVSSKAKWMNKTFFGGAAASVVIGLIGFSYLEYTKNDNNPNYVAQDVEFVKDFEVKSNDNEIIVPENTDNSIIKRSNTSNEQTQVESVSYEDVFAPDLVLNTEGNTNITTNSLATLDDLESVEIMKSGAVNVEIEFKNPNSKHLAYKFYDQKLYLFGNFNTKNPYEVIEINTKFGKEFYLKFDKSYYTIENGKVEKTPLEKVSNDKLVQKLNNLN